MEIFLQKQQQSYKKTRIQVKNVKATSFLNLRIFLPVSLDIFYSVFYMQSSLDKQQRNWVKQCLITEAINNLHNVLDTKDIWKEGTLMFNSLAIKGISFQAQTQYKWQLPFHSNLKSNWRMIFFLFSLLFETSPRICI